jgi:hypothetical protein
MFKTQRLSLNVKGEAAIFDSSGAGSLDDKDNRPSAIHKHKV